MRGLSNGLEELFKQHDLRMVAYQPLNRDVLEFVFSDKLCEFTGLEFMEMERDSKKCALECLHRIREQFVFVLQRLDAIVEEVSDKKYGPMVR